MTNHTEAPFSANWIMYAPDGLRVQFTVRGDGTVEDNVTLVHDHMVHLTMRGYSVNVPGLEPGETVEEVDAWLLGETSRGDACAYLYSSNHGLKWRIATVYVERLDELPFAIGDKAKVWPGSAPERDAAAGKGYLHAVEPFKIVMEPTGETSNANNPIMRFARVHESAVAEATPAGNGSPPPPSRNGNGGANAADLRASLEEKASWPLGQVANMAAATGAFSSGTEAIEALKQYPFDDAQQGAILDGKFAVKATQKVSREFALAAFDWLAPTKEAM